VLLGVDIALGVATALLVLVQATLLAHIVARAFYGASLGALGTDLALLALVFAARGLLAWTFEVAGAHAAAEVLSELRLELAARRLRAQPAALDGVEAAEIAAAGVHGVEGVGCKNSVLPANRLNPRGATVISAPHTQSNS
jgi:ABC-type transport system involved in cytochrome bd biosynthesis fused ATPase/permease subunit